MPEKKRRTIREIVRGVVSKRKKKTREIKDKKITDDKEKREVKKEETKEISPEQKEKEQIKKQKIKELYLKSIKIAFVLFCFVIAFFLTRMLTTHKENKRHTKKKDTLLFNFPVHKKQNPLAVFKFSNIRQNEDKLFKIQLNSPYLSVSTTMFMGYDQNDTDIEEELRERETEIINKIQYVIASKNIRDIDTIKKRELNLKIELINEINSLLGQEKIKDIYFGQFLINKIKVKE